MGKKKTCSWGHPALTVAQVRAIAENMIPAKLRPYYIGCDITNYDLSEPLTEWNTDIELYFKYPVVGCCDDSRTAHSSLYGMARELAEVMSIDESSNDDAHAEYDEDTRGRAPVEIKPLARRINWHKCGYNGID